MAEPGIVIWMFNNVCQNVSKFYRTNLKSFTVKCNECSAFDELAKA